VTFTCSCTYKGISILCDSVLKWNASVLDGAGTTFIFGGLVGLLASWPRIHKSVTYISPPPLQREWPTLLAPDQIIARIYSVKACGRRSRDWLCNESTEHGISASFRDGNELRYFSCQMERIMNASPRSSLSLTVCASSKCFVCEFLWYELPLNIPELTKVHPMHKSKRTVCNRLLESVLRDPY